MLRPLYSSKVSAGFPSPADDYIELALDMNDFVNASNPAVFYCKVSGESMINAGILDGDILVVDKSLTPNHGDIVVAVVDGAMTVKRLYKKSTKLALMPENNKFPIISIQGEMELIVWGVVTNVIRKLC